MFKDKEVLQKLDVIIKYLVPITKVLVDNSKQNNNNEEMENLLKVLMCVPTDLTRIEDTTKDLKLNLQVYLKGIADQIGDFTRQLEINKKFTELLMQNYLRVKRTKDRLARKGK